MSADLTPLERQVMEMLLAGDHPSLEVLQEQFQLADVVKRELTGAGFYLEFTLPQRADRLDAPKSFHLGDVEADIEGLEHGAGFVLYVREGAIDQLEGYSYDEPWPANVERFHLSYTGEDKRDLTVLANQ